jgi:hypothetical protein
MGMKTSLWKLKRSLNNLAFRMSFIKLTPGSSRPLLPVFSMLILATTIFILAGGLFVIVGANTGATGLVQRQSGLSFVYPGDVNNQTPEEAVFLILIYILGAVGLFMMFISTRFVYRPKRAYSYMAFGMILTAVFVTAAYFVLYDKLGFL